MSVCLGSFLWLEEYSQMASTTLIVVRLHRNLQLLRIAPQCCFLYDESVNHASCLLYGCSKVRLPDFPSQLLDSFYFWMPLASDYYDYRLMLASLEFQHVQVMIFQFFAIFISFVLLMIVFWFLLQSDYELFQSSTWYCRDLRLAFSLQWLEDLRWLLSIIAAFWSINAKSMSSFVNQLRHGAISCCVHYSSSAWHWHCRDS